MNGIFFSENKYKGKRNLYFFEAKYNFLFNFCRYNNNNKNLLFIFAML